MFSFSKNAYSQSSSLEDLRYLFALEVKSIDEFVERFNGNRNTFLLQFLKNYSDDTIPRADLINSLFNNSFQLSDSLSATRSSFVEFLLSNNRTSEISLYAKNYDVEINCDVLFGQNTYQVNIYLALIGNTNEGYCWVIKDCAFNSKLRARLLSNKAYKDLLDTCSYKNCFGFLAPNSEYFISPVNHIIGFSSLYYVFKSNLNVDFYIDRRSCNKEIILFSELIKDDLITLKSINNLTYYFYQIPGWLFTVENLKNPNNYNINGWIIKDLVAINSFEDYKRHLNKRKNI